MASFLNGLGSLAAGLGAFTANSAADEQARAKQPAEIAPTAPAAATPEPTSAPAAPTGATAAIPAPAPAAAVKPGMVPTGVPAELLPIYQAAAKRTGIPVAVLIAQGKQESNFRTDAVGSAGEIGIMQVKPSTASAPGFGLKGIDPATLKDPRANIEFAASYLRARAGQGVDFSDPAAVDAALAKYNSGGDPNYVANVRRHMGDA